MPRIVDAVMFNTPEADRILTALQVFPPDNPWNEDISKRPVHPDSKRLVASVGTEKNLAYNLDMAFILVPARAEESRRSAHRVSQRNRTLVRIPCRIMHRSKAGRFLASRSM